MGEIVHIPVRLKSGVAVMACEVVSRCLVPGTLRVRMPTGQMLDVPAAGCHSTREAAELARPVAVEFA